MTYTKQETEISFKESDREIRITLLGIPTQGILDEAISFLKNQRPALAMTPEDLFCKIVERWNYMTPELKEKVIANFITQAKTL